MGGYHQEPSLLLAVYEIQSRLWEDHSFLGPPLGWSNSFENVLPGYLCSLFQKEALIFECWGQWKQAWNLGLRRGSFDRELQNWVLLIEKLNPVQLEANVVRIFWSLEGSGVYSSRSAFHTLAEKPTKVNTTLTSLIWKHKCLKKVKVFLRSLAYRSPNTDDILQKKLGLGPSYPRDPRSLISSLWVCLLILDLLGQDAGSFFLYSQENDWLMEGLRAELERKSQGGDRLCFQSSLVAHLEG